MSPTPGYLPTTGVVHLGERKSAGLETTSAFLRKQLSEGVSHLLPPSQVSVSVVTWQGKEQSTGLSTVLFHSTARVHCVCPMLGFLW